MLCLTAPCLCPCSASAQALPAPLLPAGTVVVGAVADTLVAKFREQAEAQNTVRISLASVRLPGNATDILVTVNDPVRIAPGSSSAAAGAEAKSAGAAGPLVLERALRSFAIKDYGLFG